MIILVNWGQELPPCSLNINEDTASFNVTICCSQLDKQAPCDGNYNGLSDLATGDYWLPNLETIHFTFQFRLPNKQWKKE